MGAEGDEAASERIIRQADDSLRYLNWSLFSPFFFLFYTWKLLVYWINRVLLAVLAVMAKLLRVTARGYTVLSSFYQAYMDICAYSFQRKN